MQLLGGGGGAGLLHQLTDDGDQGGGTERRRFRHLEREKRRFKNFATDVGLEPEILGSEVVHATDETENDRFCTGFFFLLFKHFPTLNY